MVEIEDTTKLLTKLGPTEQVWLLLLVFQFQKSPFEELRSLHQGYTATMGQ
jgi:hypothetical protein